METLALALEELAGSDPGMRAAAALARLVVLVEARRPDDAQRLATEALALARRAGRDDLEVELMWDLTAIHWEAGRQSEAADAARHGLAILDRIDAAGSLPALEGTRTKLLHALGTILSMSCRLAEGNRSIEQARALAQRDGFIAGSAVDGATLADNAIAQGDLPAAQRYSGEALAEARSIEAGPDTLGRVLWTRATTLALAGDLGGALALLEESIQAGEGAVRRHDVLFRRTLHWLHYELGRHDLALKGLRQLHSEANLPPTPRLLVEAGLLRLGEPLDAAALLDRAIATSNTVLRGRVLCLAAPACEPDRVLPLLAMTAATARENGAWGLWLGLQAHSIPALRALGREAEALSAAEAAWRILEDGRSPIEPFPRLARELCLVWRGRNDDLAQLVGLRASAWMQRAAMGLPPGWRENYLHRAPARVAATLLPP